jgi:transcription elongation factor GreA
MSVFPTAAVEHDVLVTADGHAQIRAELEFLRTVRRDDLTEQLREVRQDRDADSPVLYDLLEEQAQLHERISALEAQLAFVQIAEPASDGKAGIGSWVRVRHGDGDVAEYVLVGALEADVGNGRVSVGAPVGRALVGSRRGDVVDVETPRGTTRLEVLDVQPVPHRAARKAA